MNIDTLKFIQQLFQYVSFTCFIFLIIGLFRPWVMLWWEDVQNRRKVIKLYGSVGMVFYVAYLGMDFYIKTL
jgi:hypothetical protein